MSYKVENLENSMAKITIEVSPEAFEEAMKNLTIRTKTKLLFQVSVREKLLVN